MAINLNRATLIGRLGAEPEPRGSGGLALSVATSESWKDKQTGDWQERTQWHKVIIWNEHVAANISKNARKGDLVCVEGMIETRKYLDRDNNERWVTEIVVKQFGGNVQVLPKDGYNRGVEPERNEANLKKADAALAASAPRQSAPKTEAKATAKSRFDEDEIPF